MDAVDRGGKPKAARLEDRVPDQHPDEQDGDRAGPDRPPVPPIRRR
jgi:hypothetical protein